ncbi:16S rRNA (cytosine(967)-C(5))-methyltransferase RsmB [Ruminococcus sp.]|uniref:16S rRNA (cytosine(967)-C(5))-methyltransferase RsmB n=1 Tax=Ruminococcus sp. TaxID=41978 RepID=UPI0025D10313|nr:16S rRNA (cytosine(967)-C(5))-methyltransferase RsmB [Ruminococcus sp.]MBQ8965354.1 16S rRNA (cytosine(967)-C(5))-methyltransferase RsmB [Ruminococcus sp.]
MGNTRKFTVKLLTKLDENSSYSNILLDEALGRSDFDKRDKKFISALFYGVLERRLTLDAIIAELSKNPKNKLNHTLRNILRCGLYQLKYMDSVPDNAAVDESVELAKKLRNPAASGFANGLLREFIRRDKALPKAENEIKRLSLEYSCPEWLVKKWLDEYGKDKFTALLESSLGQAPTTVRLNNLKGSAEETLDMFLKEGMTFERSKYLDYAVNVANAGAIEKTEAFRQGRFHVQDLASQLCCRNLDPQPGEIILDLCSAPGGKTFTIAEMMNNEGRVLAFDLHPNRVKLIRSGAERLGLTCVTADVNNAKVFNSELPAADRVLVDAPCSGLGVIRRKPEIKYKSPEDFDRLPMVQYDILDTASKYVKVGGLIVYSTCTVSRAENDEVIKRFLSEHEAFERDGDDFMQTITPDMYGSDGFFIARLRRRR